MKSEPKSERLRTLRTCSLLAIPSTVLWVGAYLGWRKWGLIGVPVALAAGIVIMTFVALAWLRRRP